MYSGVQVKRLERVNRVGETELFTNALKQTRAQAATEKHADHAHRVATRIAVGEGGATDHDMSLGRITLEVHGARRLHDWSRRGKRWQTAARNLAPSSRFESVEQSVVDRKSTRLN